jgi:hypothetical protein
MNKCCVWRIVIGFFVYTTQRNESRKVLCVNPTSTVLFQNRLINTVHFRRILWWDWHRLALKDSRKSHPLACCAPSVILSEENRSPTTIKTKTSFFPSRATESGVRAPVQRYFRPPPQKKRTDKGKSKETKQRASYARWPLAASDVDTTNSYLTTTDNTEKDRNISNIWAPGPLTDRPILSSALFPRNVILQLHAF